MKKKLLLLPLLAFSMTSLSACNIDFSELTDAISLASEYQQEYEELMKTLEELQAQIQELQDMYINLNSEMNDQIMEVKNQYQPQIDAIANQINEKKAALEELKKDAETNASAISDLETEIASLEAELEALKEEMNAQIAAIRDQYNSQIQDILNRLATLEGNKPVHTVTFDSNGGTDVESQKVKHGEKLKKPQEPVKEGSTFVGWYADTDEQWVFCGYTVTEDMTLTAHWE